ncbi:MAG: DinB family protein [Phycisphaerales bacterium]
MKAQELLAQQILANKVLLGRYLEGFNDVTAVRQTPDLPNHVCWCLGHCALTMHRVCALLTGDATPALPATDFIPADGHSGSREKGYFDTEAIAFGSRPQERHDKFPTLARSRAIFDAACDRLAEVARSLPDADIDRPLRWGGGEVPAWALITRMTFHNGFHTGQIADLRRALSFKSIFA